MRYLEDILFIFKLMSFVADDDTDTGVEECLFSESCEEGGEVEFRCIGEDFRVRFESDEEAMVIGIADTLELACDISSLEAHGIAFAFVSVIDLEPFGECVYDRCANAVETA